MPINTGTWRFHYLERLAAHGAKFTVVMRRLSLMMETHMEDPDEQIVITVGEHLIAGANLAWADATNLYLVYIDGVKPGGEFDWSLIGLEVNDSKKMGKRLQEVTRLANWATSRTLSTKAISPEQMSKDPDFWVKALDGKNVVKMSALPHEAQAKLMKSGVRHVMGRGWTWTWMDNAHRKVLVKGDFVVIDDQEWLHDNYDVVAHVENCKSEVVLCTSDEWIGHEDMWTFWSHDPLHNVTWDQQTMGNYPYLLPLSAMKADYLAEMGAIDAQLAKGLLPGQVEDDQQVQGLDENHDSMKQHMPKPNEIAKNRDLASKVKNAGLDVRMFQNLTYLSVKGFADSKAKFYHMDTKQGDPLHGAHDKHVVTMRNSFRATVVTDTFLKHFAGVEYPENRIARFDKRYGLVWNGTHFCRSFELHGTHDNDDSHSVVPFYFFGNPAHVGELKKRGVMLNSLEIPTTKEQAKLLVLVLRLPNGAGEYSIMEFDFTTWPESIPLDMDLIPTVEIDFSKGFPKPQGMVMPKDIAGLKTSRVYSKAAYTRADMELDFWAQTQNPGFGQICNALLTYSICTGGKIPACMPDSLGNIVDATQQGADKESFKQISGLIDLIQQEMTGNQYTRMDRYMYHRRGSVAKRAVRAGKVKAVIEDLFNFDKEYKEVYETLRVDLKNKYALKMRLDDPINQKLMNELKFSREQIEWGRTFLSKLNADIEEADKRQKDIPLTKFTKPLIEAAARERRHKVIDEALESIESKNKPLHVALLLWYVTIKPHVFFDKFQYGCTDRGICQMGSEKSIAHLVVDAIVAYLNEDIQL